MAEVVCLFVCFFFVFFFFLAALGIHCCTGFSLVAAGGGHSGYDTQASHCRGSSQLRSVGSRADGLQ